MKFSEKWLREWVNPPINSEQLQSQLTMLGLEVDSSENLAGQLAGIFVGEVLEVKPHPEADRLRICQVRTDVETAQVICGAPNVKQGMKCAFAVVGARLPSGLRIKKAKLRGQASLGMLCSEAELGLSDDSEGLMALPQEAEVGMSLSKLLNLDDTVIDIDITPNRGDCFCIRGIARDIAARNNISNIAFTNQPVEVNHADSLKVHLEPDNACVRYTGRIISGIDNTVRAPVWMTERLRRSGVRSISLIVDVTNYVMLELGQPMHAYDLDKLSGDITVRKAANSENLSLLDGRCISLQRDTTVIADDKGAIGIAGIMGGLTTGCDKISENIFLESALFLPELIAGKSRYYSVHTESGHRFERGVDPQLQREALEYATRLIIDIGKGDVGEIVDVAMESRLPLADEIVLRKSRIERLLGLEVTAEQVESILEKLGVKLQRNADDWLAIAPSYRYDIRIEADLIEEVARVYGYDNLPRTFAMLSPEFKQVEDNRTDLDTLKRFLLARGFQEVITYSFVDHAIQNQLHPNLKTLALANPISSDMGVMRASHWTGLLAALEKNLNRQINDIRIFESGLCFRPGSHELVQERLLSGLISGKANLEHWAESDREVDFFDLKGILESLFKITHIQDIEFVAAQHCALHPGQSALITQKGETLGWLGSLHPNLQKSLNLSQTAVMFEVRQDVLETNYLPKFNENSKFPAVRRDIAIVIRDNIPMISVQNTVLQSAPEFLQKIIIFDVYRGDKVASGLKSVALGLILQDKSRTLDESDVENTVSGIIKVLEEKFSATLRM